MAPETPVRTPAEPQPPVTVGLVTMLAANVVAGAPVYFVAFLLAYGFRDVVGAPEHLAFLLVVSAFGCVTGLVGAAADGASTRRRPRESLAVVLPASLSLNYVVLAAGSVVSARHEAEGSVSAGFSTTTDVLVAGGLLVAAVVLAVLARRAALSRGGRNRG